MSYRTIGPLDKSFMTKGFVLFCDDQGAVRELSCRWTGLVLRRNTSFSYANCVDSDQMPHFVASDLGLHCLQLSLFMADAQAELSLLCVHIPLHLFCLVAACMCIQF